MTKRQTRLVSQIVKYVDDTNSFDKEKNLRVNSLIENNPVPEDEQNKTLKESLVFFLI